MKKFTLFVGKDKKFYFNLKADNHEIILQSQKYQSKQAAEKGIESVRVNSQMDNRFNRLVAKNSEPYFTLEAANGELIGVGETYSSNANMENGIASVKANALHAMIDDVTNAGPRNDGIVIFLNKRKYKVSDDSMTGAEILALGDYSQTSYCLFLVEGIEQKEIKATESVVLTNGMKFQAIENNIKFG